MTQIHLATTAILSDTQKTQVLIQAIKHNNFSILKIQLEDAYQYTDKGYKAAPHKPAILTNLEALLSSLYGNFQIKTIFLALPNDRDPKQYFLYGSFAGFCSTVLGGITGFLGGMFGYIAHAAIGTPFNGLYFAIREGLKSHFNIQLPIFPIITAHIGTITGILYPYIANTISLNKMKPSRHCKNFNNAVTALYQKEIAHLVHFSAFNLELYAQNKDAYTKSLATRLQNVINDETKGCFNATQKRALWEQWKNTLAGRLLTNSTAPESPASPLKTLIFSTTTRAAADRHGMSAVLELRQRTMPPLH